MRRWPVLLTFAVLAAGPWNAAASLVVPPAAAQPADRSVPSFALPPIVAGRAGPASADPGRGKPRLFNVSGIRIDAIAVHDRLAAVTRFLERAGHPFAEVRDDRRGVVAAAFGAAGLPETPVIGRRGWFASRHIGDIHADAVSAMLAYRR